MVIDNVPIDAPNGLWFDELEELNQSRPEGVVVCGYSSRSVKVPELTKAIDGFKQHLHAGYIAALAPDDSTFSYPILTLKRASGSPVYQLDLWMVGAAESRRLLWEAAGEADAAQQDVGNPRGMGT